MTNSYQGKTKKLKERTARINQEIKELEAKLNPPRKGIKRIRRSLNLTPLRLALSLPPSKILGLL